MKTIIKSLKIIFIISAIFSFTTIYSSAQIVKRDILYLSKDVIKEKKGYKSLIIWKLQVKDHTSDTEDYKYNFTFDSEYGPYAATWKTENGIAYYDAFYVVQTQPNVDVELFSLLMPGKYYSPGSLIIHTYRAFNVPEGKAIYLGEFNMEILKRNHSKDPSVPTTYEYDLTLNQESGGKETALNDLQENLPKLYEKFKNNIEPPKFYLFYDEFNSLTSKLKVSDVESRWVERKDNPNCDSYYDWHGFSLHPKDNLCYSQTVRQDYQLPENCIINLQSHWKEGLKSSYYGFLLGTDQFNCIHFDITAMGEIRVWEITEGKNVRNIYTEETNSSVNKGDGKIRNEHYIKKVGDMLTLYVNGNEVSNFKNPLVIDKNNWVIGISVTGDQIVEFNKLSIISL